MRTLAATTIELAGIAAVLFGLWQVSPVLAYVVGGLMLLAVGILIDPVKKRDAK